MPSWTFSLIWWGLCCLAAGFAVGLGRWHR